MQSMKDGVRRVRASGLLAALAVAASLGVGSAAWSAIRYVDGNTGDTYSPPSGSTVYATIQAAIDAAANGDVVKVYPHTYTSTGAEVVNLRGKRIVLEAAIPRIPGDLSTYARIDGQNERRCVVATLNETAATVVRGFELWRGRASSGAGMYVVNGSPTIEDVYFNACVAANGLASGGGLRLLTSFSKIENCYFIGNEAGVAGGAIYSANGPIVVTNCDFASNRAGAEGGAVFNMSGSISVIGCDFAGNTALRGGGLFTRDDASTVTDCVFRDTSYVPCSGESFFGLGAYALDSRVVFSDCDFQALELDNYCYGTNATGAGLFVIGAVSDVLVLRCQFLGNRARSYGRGGAIGVGWPGNNRGSVRVAGCVFRNNLSTIDGGAIAMQSIDRLEIDDAGGVPTIFENNSSNRHGGAISVNVDWVGAGTFQLDDAIFRGNGAGSQGGAIWIRQTDSNGSRSLTDASFFTNEAADGGALYLEGSSILTRIERTAYCGNAENSIAGSYSQPSASANCFTDDCGDDNGNGFPDICDFPITDCNGNNISDDEELVGNDINNDGVPDDCQSDLDFAGLETEIRPITHVVNGLPQTAVCWRVYATFRKGASLATVTAMFGNSQRPLLVSNAAGFYQSPAGGNTVEDIACNSADTSLRYDSFFTISAECRSQTELQTSTGLSFGSFNAESNASFTTSNGAIFVAPNTAASRAGDDLRILLMQLTTKSITRPTATLNLTGDNAVQAPDNEWYAYALPIPAPAVTSAVDCNGNATHDALEIAAGTVRDCNLDGIPDSCQSPDLAADCDGDGTPDACEILFGSAVDVNGDGVPDNCQCQGDVDRNGAVNIDDLLEIFAAWGDPSPGAADLDGDGACNAIDLCLVLEGWGACL